LKEYADENDEIVFAEKYPYADDASRLPVIGEKKLKIPEKRAKIDGGFMLCGLISDKDLSFDALLQADRDEYQAEIAAELFKTK
jgi:hypothetical protein